MKCIHPSACNVSGWIYCCHLQGAHHNDHMKSQWIFSEHFVSRKPADLYDETNADCGLPTCCFGHQKKKRASTDRFERRKKWTAAKEDMDDYERMDDAITAALEEYPHLENIGTKYQPNKAAESSDRETQTAIASSDRETQTAIASSDRATQTAIT